MVTIPNVCLNVYSLSQHRGGITLQLIDSFFCFGTCLMQIFLYCWYGNKIILHVSIINTSKGFQLIAIHITLFTQSLDVANAVYEMNWPLLGLSSKKKLLTIMVRANRSIKFAAGTFIMNINSFIEVSNCQNLFQSQICLIHFHN